MCALQLFVCPAFAHHSIMQAKHMRYHKPVPWLAYMLQQCMPSRHPPAKQCRHNLKANHTPLTQTVPVSHAGGAPAKNVPARPYIRHEHMSLLLLCLPASPATAIALWTATGDEDHIWIVGSYFHYSVPGGFEEPQCKDISPRGGLFGKSDPMYVVWGQKKA